VLAAALLLVALASPAAVAEALRDGNALFRDGDLEGTLAAYAAACDPRAPEPQLAYNLGATAHRLGRLPEAILWYRRAELAGGTDPWLADNLALARSALATGAPPPPGPLAWAARYATTFEVAGVLLTWTGFLLVLARRGARALPALLAAAGAVVFAASPAVRAWGPQPAVLLAPCAAADLAAGSEVWVRPLGEGFRVLGGADGEVACDAEAIAPLRPRG
jgi:tetratricopeptide (TPR) repeat protein